MIFGSNIRFIDIRDSSKMVLTTSTVPEVAIFQNGHQKLFLAIITLIIIII